MSQAPIPMPPRPVAEDVVLRKRSVRHEGQETDPTLETHGEDARTGTEAYLPAQADADDHKTNPSDATRKIAEAMEKRKNEHPDTDLPRFPAQDGEETTKPSEAVTPDSRADEPQLPDVSETGNGQGANAIPTQPRSAYLDGITEAARHLRSVQANPKGLAEQITRGEFGPNGAGDAGRIWRAAAALHNTVDLVDVWGEIMATSTGLWQNGFQNEAISFVDGAARSFPIPAIWQERVENALKQARDFRAALEAEEAFSEGRDEDAMHHAQNISNQAEAEHYRRVLKQRTERRSRQRKAIFASAAAAIVGLITASVIAIGTMERINIAPPAPDFAGFGDTLETISEDLRDQRTTRDAASDGSTPALNPLAISDLDLNGTTAPTPETPTEDQIEAVLDTPTNPDAKPTEPAPALDQAQPFQPVNTPNPEPDAATPTEPAVTPTVDSTPKPTEAEADALAMRNACILGYAGMAEAQRLVEDGRAQLTEEQRTTVDTRITAFGRTLESACAPVALSPLDIARGVGGISPTEARDVAEDILTAAP